MDDLVITQPENGGPYMLNRPMTRAEMLDLLHRCQDGEASCLYVLKAFEAHMCCKPQGRPCPYDGVAYSQVPGYVEGYGCPVCKAISFNHIPIYP